jgi:hypothetical protein
MEKTLQYIGVALVVGTVVLVYQWSAITGYWIRCDLRDYAHTIRHCECSIQEKEQLLDQVEKIEDNLQRGRCIGWLRWRETDLVIRDLLQGGINSDKARLVIREFKRLERNL